jgi:alcohol dehydrogenase (NADP+)
MKYFPMPSGNIMPGIGLGTWKSDPGVVGQALRTAIQQCNFRHIDCAAIYGNEKEIGTALKMLFDEGVVVREDLFLTSKLWNSNHHPKNVEPALRQTLADLQVDYLDLYLMHWPVVTTGDGEMVSLDEIPLLDTWRAMEACREKGMCKDIGVSNFSKRKLQDLCKQVAIKPAVNQIELHPYLQMEELLEYGKEEGIHFTAYSPLGSNDRPSFLKKDTEKPILKDPVINEIARKHNVTSAQVLIAWALERGTSCIPKSVSPERLKQNIDATKLALEKEDMETISQLDEHRRYVDGSFWCKEGSPYTLETLWDEDASLQSK